MLEYAKTLLFIAMRAAPVKVSGSGWYLYISRSMVSERIDRQAYGTRVSYSKSFLGFLRANLGYRKNLNNWTVCYEVQNSLLWKGGKKH